MTWIKGARGIKDRYGIPVTTAILYAKNGTLPAKQVGGRWYFAQELCDKKFKIESTNAKLW